MGAGHTCSVCYKVYAKLELLKRHAKSHWDTRPYQCCVCSRGFARSDALLRHKRLLHKDELDEEDLTAPRVRSYSTRDAPTRRTLRTRRAPVRKESVYDSDEDYTPPGWTSTDGNCRDDEHDAQYSPSASSTSPASSPPALSSVTPVPLPVLPPTGPYMHCAPSVEQSRIDHVQRVPVTGLLEKAAASVPLIVTDSPSTRRRSIPRSGEGLTAPPSSFATRPPPPPPAVQWRQASPPLVPFRETQEPYSSPTHPRYLPVLQTTPIRSSAGDHVQRQIYGAYFDHVTPYEYDQAFEPYSMPQQATYGYVPATGWDDYAQTSASYATSSVSSFSPVTPVTPSSPDLQHYTCAWTDNYTPPRFGYYV